MKTLKITEQAHTDLSVVMMQEYKKTGIKMTYSEIIANLVIMYHRERRQK